MIIFASNNQTNKLNTMGDQEKKIESLRLSIEYFKIYPRVSANDILKMAEDFYLYIK